MLEQCVDNGITLFMQRVGTAYTMYFNTKYERTGVLFQGTYKRVEVSELRYHLYLPHYIHLNPLPLQRADDARDPLTFLLAYKWSSFPDYVGTPKYPSIIDTMRVLDMFGGKERYLKDIRPFILGHTALAHDDASVCLDPE
jgi:putative transposase